MLTEALILAGIGTFAQMWKSIDLDDDALCALRRAYDTHANAVVLFERKKRGR